VPPVNEQVSDESNRAVTPKATSHLPRASDRIPWFTTYFPTTLYRTQSEALLSATSASLAAMMHDTITPCSDSERTVSHEPTSKWDENGQTMEQHEVVNVG
jgi:hypothetical protein